MWNRLKDLDEVGWQYNLRKSDPPRDAEGPSTLRTLQLKRLAIDMVSDAFTPRDAKMRKRRSPDKLNGVAPSPSRGGAERQQAAKPHRHQVWQPQE